MADDDFAFEPLPGLPERLPRGEMILWQGRPDTFRLAWEAFGLRWIALYFAALVLWRGSVGFDAAGTAGALAFAIPYVLLGLAGAAVVLALAWAQARATVYTITTARVAMRIGAALSVTFNLPFAQVAEASLAMGPGGTGTVALRLMPEARISYLVAWPHVRPWHFLTQPSLRCIPDAARVAEILADAAATRIATPRVTAAVPATAVAAE